MQTATLKINRKMIRNWRLDVEPHVSGLTVIAPEDMKLTEVGQVLKQSILELEGNHKNFIIRDGKAIPVKKSKVI